MLNQLEIYLLLWETKRLRDTRAWQEVQRVANAINLLPTFTHSHPKDAEVQKKEVDFSKLHINLVVESYFLPLDIFSEYL